MLVFRICLTKWSSALTASGQPARWNSKGKLVIYTAENRSLSCLENLAHRIGLGKNNLFRIVVINIPDDVSIETLSFNQLPQNWNDFSNYPACQKLGNLWIDSFRSCVLKIPSAIIPQEYNFLINPLHKEFSKIKIKSVEDFNFDKRLIRM